MIKVVDLSRWWLAGGSIDLLSPVKHINFQPIFKSAGKFVVEDVTDEDLTVLELMGISVDKGVYFLFDLLPEKLPEGKCIVLNKMLNVWYLVEVESSKLL